MYAKHANALNTHVKSQYKSVLNDLIGLDKSSNPKIDPRYEGQQPYISEAGLYALVFASKLPTADAFRTWVFEEVLPSIRKDGQYQLSQTLEAKSVELSNALKAIEDEKATGVQTRAMLEKERKAKEDAIAEEKRSAENLERQKAAT